MTAADDNEIKKYVKSLRDSSAGCDGISAKSIKLIMSSITKPIVHLVNLSLQEGVFPNELKIARVIPIYKSNDPMIFGHYRPVSVLPVLSKVFEKAMYSRMLSFLYKHELLYKHQYGFKQNHSTYMALIILLDKLSTALENGDYTLGIFLDFSKAFDTIDHCILLKKLEMYGIRGTAHKWLSSYLSNRFQYVEYNDARSLPKEIICGVPQGSILGPLLFLIYINDLATVAPKLFSLMFADDSNLFLQGKDLKVMQQTLNDELDKVSTWLKINKLSLNIDKTHFMLFCGRRSVTEDISIKIDGISIQRVSSTKFLGVTIDELLSWKEHICNISKKVSRALGIINKVKCILNKSTLLSLYYTLVYPYMTYCNHVWGNACQNYVYKLVKLQKKAIRIITASKYNAHTSELFSELKCLTFGQIHTYQMGVFMYRYVNMELPDIFDYMFVFNAEVHQYPTRGSNLLHVPIVKTNLGKKSPRFLGVALWNSICKEFLHCTSLCMFKKHYKQYLIRQQL